MELLGVVRVYFTGLFFYGQFSTHLFSGFMVRAIWWWVGLEGVVRVVADPPPQLSEVVEEEEEEERAASPTRASGPLALIHPSPALLHLK